VDVDAPLDGVSRALLGTPELLRVVNAEKFLYSGYVPGTPVGQVGG
jgi:hypothetical protein